MKTTAIIPIFIPHKGCPNDCVFCNQKEITARQKPAEREDVRKRVEMYLPTLLGRGLSTIEIAFFGGSFTGIPLEEQSGYLEIAREYKDRGLVQKIRLSTRPDYIDGEILDNLERYGVDLIELGAQSFDEDVLRLSNRGHRADAVCRSAGQIRERGFELGIQLMIGLPGDTKEKSIRSAREAVKLRPAVARLYPTVILRETQLCRDWQAGLFQPFTQEEMVDVTKDMYRILTGAGVNVIRVGLKSTDLISGKEGSAAAPETYHPAFRQLVCGAIAREELERQLEALTESKPAAFNPWADKRSPGGGPRVLFESCGAEFSDMVGNRGANRAYFQRSYPEFSFRFGRDDSLGKGNYRTSWDKGK